jgi:hypothetical protein
VRAARVRGRLTCGWSWPLLTVGDRLCPVVPVRHGPSADRGTVPFVATPPVLRSSATRNRSGRQRTARPIKALTPCMPCSFRSMPHPRSEAGTEPNGLPGVTVTDRWIPLVTAAYGTRVARPARTTTMLRPGGDDSQLDRRVRPSSSYHCVAGKSPKGSRQVEHNHGITAGSAGRLVYCELSLHSSSNC